MLQNYDGPSAESAKLVAAATGLAAGLGISLAFVGLSEKSDPKEEKARKQLALEARSEYLQWKAMGKPKLGEDVIDMKKPAEADEAALRTLFRKLDLDNDGKIDKDELREFLKSVGDVALRSQETGFSDKIASYVGIGTPTGLIPPSNYQKIKLENMLHSLMDKYDINKDKALDEYEFWKLCNEFLANYIPMKMAAL